MKFRVEVEGDILDLAEEIREEYVPAAKAVVAEASDLALAEVRRLLRLRIGTIRSAAPIDEPPEYDTGDLDRSFTRIRPRVIGAMAIGGIQSNSPSANRIEFGFTDERGIRTFPHPVVRPAMENTEAAIDELITKRLNLADRYLEGAA